MPYECALMSLLLSAKFLSSFADEQQKHNCGRLMLLVIFPDDRPDGVIANGKAGSAWWCPECDKWYHFYLSSHISVGGKLGCGGN